MLYRLAIAADPHDADAYYWLALICDAEEGWEEALIYYQNAVRIDTNHVDALVAIGDIMGVILQDWDFARLYYGKALERTNSPLKRKRILEKLRCLPQR